MTASPDGPLLEREAELEALEAALGAAAEGTGRVVLLEGTAGIGKSELLDAARRRASESGLGVLTARGSELERDVPFGVALELFAPTLQAVGPSDRGTLFRAAARWALAVGAPDTAVRYLRRALAEPPPGTARAEVLAELGQAEAMVGDPAALDHLYRAVELMSDGPTRAAALYEFGRALVDQGRYREAIASLRKGLDELGEARSGLRHRLLAALLQANRLHPGHRHRSDILVSAEAAVDQDGEAKADRRALLGELAFGGSWPVAPAMTSRWRPTKRWAAPGWSRGTVWRGSRSTTP